MCIPYPFFKKTVMGPWMACPLFCIGGQLHKKQTTKYTKQTKNQREVGDFILVYLVCLPLGCPCIGDWGGASPLVLGIGEGQRPRCPKRCQLIAGCGESGNGDVALPTTTLNDLVMRGDLQAVLRLLPPVTLCIARNNEI